MGNRFAFRSSGRLRAAEDTFQHRVDLVDIEFTLLRTDSREYRDFLQKLGDQDQLSNAAWNRVFLGQMDGTVPPETKAEDALKRAIEEELRDRLSKGESSLRLMRGDSGRTLEKAVALVKGWSGAGVQDAETEQPIPCTPEAVRELFTLSDYIAEGEGAGLEVGDFLVAEITRASKARAEIHQRVLAEAVKTSAPSSAG